MATETRRPLTTQTILRFLLGKGRRSGARPIGRPANLNGFPAEAMRPDPRAASWADIVAAHVVDHFEPVPEEMIIAGFHAYSEEAEAPLNAIDRRLAAIDAELFEGFHALQDAAPDLIRRALDRTPLEVRHYIPEDAQ